MNNRVETLFRAMFFKFSQNRILARKLLATGDVGLFEATTDRFYGCGLEYNSKRWMLGDWTGKNLAGKILMRVREILREKIKDGIDLSSLSFNFSPPSFRHERSAYLMSQQLRPPLQSDSPLHQDMAQAQIQPLVTSMEAGYGENGLPTGDLPPAGKLDTNSRLIPSDQLGTGKIDNIEELSAVLEAIEAKVGLGDGRNDSNRINQQQYTTVHNWSSYRQSHSLSRSQTNTKERNNPKRSNDSLTHRERDYIHRSEEDNIESNPLTGFDRCYGCGWSENEAAINRLSMPRPSSSMPCPGALATGVVHHTHTCNKDLVMKEVLLQ